MMASTEVPTGAVLMSQQVRDELRSQVDQLKDVVDRLERLISDDDDAGGGDDEHNRGDRRAP